MGPPQYQKTLSSWDLVRPKQVLYIYRDNKITHVPLSSDSGRDSLPGTLGGSQSQALRNQNYPTHATLGATPSTGASGGITISG